MTARVRRRERGDLRAYERAVRLVEAQEATRVIIAALCEIPVHERMGMQWTLPRAEVARKERDFVGHVDPTEGGLVLQAIKGAQPCAKPYHVAAVQVAVTLADTAVRP